MPEIVLPYGRGSISTVLPEKNLLGIYHAALPPAAADAVQEVESALDAPIDSATLEELAAGRRNAVIIASDHTRPVPSKVLMPALLRRLRKSNPSIDITILIATGCHRRTTRDELIGKFGSTIVENEKIVIHDSADENMLVSLGKLPSGGELKLNKLAVETDLLLAEGFIEPHFFAGFSGGRKSVLPGIAARETVMANHCAEFINSEFARTGNLENNPIHQDMLYAAKKANLAFILNVVIDGSKSIVRAFAGNPESAHLCGCKYLAGQCRVRVPQADIVITGNGGYPMDQNIYQSVKSMAAGEAVCRPGGVLIIAASCSDGHGGEAFYQTLSKMRSPAELLENISKVPRNQTEPDQWQYQIFARILQKHRVIIVSRDCSSELIKAMHLDAADSLEKALEKAYAITNRDAAVAVIPDGVSVIAEKADF